MPEGKQEFEVRLLVCPACGGQIEGSGNCPRCGQLLVITKNHELLQIDSEDIKDVRIKSPTEEERATKRNQYWEIGSSNWSESQLIVLGGGHPEYGAKLVAFYYAKHPEEVLPGTRVPSAEKVETFALSTAIKQSSK